MIQHPFVESSGDNRISRDIRRFRLLPVRLLRSPSEECLTAPSSQTQSSFSKRIEKRERRYAVTLAIAIGRRETEDMIYEAELARAEETLRAAMLAGDVTALSALIDDRLVFTSPDGTVVNKDQDLSAHASSVLKLTEIDLTDGQFHPVGDMVLATTKATLAGTFGGMTIDGTYAYTRLWSRASGQWRVIAGQAARIG